MAASFVHALKVSSPLMMINISVFVSILAESLVCAFQQLDYEVVGLLDAAIRESDLVTHFIL